VRANLNVLFFKMGYVFLFYLNVCNVYVVLNMCFLLFQIRKSRKVKPINHGARFWISDVHMIIRNGFGIQ